MEYWIEAIISPRTKEIQQSGDIPSDLLFHVSKAGLHGVIDMHQKFVVPLEFDSMNFLGDMYQLRKVVPDISDSLIFFFDPKSQRMSKTGARAGDAVYQQASEGLIEFMPLKRREANTSAHQWQPPMRGYCDIDHNVVIKPSPGFGNPFHDGLALVRAEYPPKALGSPGTSPSPNERNIFIDKTGKFVAPEVIPMGWFMNGVAVASPASPDAGPRSIATAPRVGLIDQQFHFVVKPEYESLEYLNGHVFIARLPGSDHFTAISDDGRKLGDFPKEITKIEPNDLRPTNPDLVVAQCEDPSFKPSDEYSPHDCIVNLQGKIMAPPKFYLQQIRHGLVQAIDRRSPRGDQKCGIMNTSGDLVIPLQKADFCLTQENRIIKTVQSDGFDPGEWMENPAGRLGIFAAFLDQYNLIGMPYHRVVELLGQGTDAPVSAPGTFTSRYTLMSGTCGNQWNGLDIQFEHRAVKAWRFSGPNEDPKAHHTWYTENMIFDPEASTLNCKLVAKPN
jgi:hypothetical protein